MRRACGESTGAPLTGVRHRSGVDVLVKLDCKVRSAQQCASMLYGLQRASFFDLLEQARAGRPYPRLYESGVRYRPEPPGREQWQLPWETLKLGNGDCEDLAAWRAAELWFYDRDMAARAILRDWGSGTMHCLVMHGDGTIEDPSKALGMKGRA